MTPTTFIRVSFIILSAIGLAWSQSDEGARPAAEEIMSTPSPVSLEGPSLAFEVEREHTNYLRGGISFSPAYDDGLLFSTGGGDVTYSIRPTIAIDESGARLHWSLFYSPGFILYQRNSPLDQSNHDLLAEFEYRLSPHVTLTLRDDLTKSSAYSYHFDPNPAAPTTGILQSANQTPISLLADTLLNSADGQITYQFSENGMIGGGGSERELRYLNPAQAIGFADSSTRIGTAFYSYRLSGKHYIGATYQYQQLLTYSHPNGNQTKTQGAFLFYTLYPNSSFSLSFFGGPQHFEFTGADIPTKTGWAPAGGATLGWQGRHTSANLSFARRVTDGSGLQSSALSTTAGLSVRRQLDKDLTVTLSGAYAVNTLVDPLLPGSAGHTVSGGISAQRRLGDHFSAEAGYDRAHQSYSNIPILSTFPNRNHVWVAFSYNFERPLGR